MHVGLHISYHSNQWYIYMDPAVNVSWFLIEALVME